MLHFVKAGSRVEEEYTYCRNRAEAERWGNTGGHKRDISYISSVNFGKGEY